MAPLGPFGPAPRLAVAVSGGADSLCLALLADAWARGRGGAVLGLIVDHGLRPEAAAEARLTAERLAARGIASRVLVLDGLRPGPGVAARARAARHAALLAATAAAGIVHLLFAHHAADQAETLMIRSLAGSHADGLAGMAAVTAAEAALVLRPLLGVPPARLRATLRESAMGWVEDPSNADPRARRARLRRLADGQGTGALAAAAHVAGRARAAGERRTAAWLAAHAVLRPEGFALIPAAPLPAPALAALLRAVGGLAYPPDPAAVARLAATPGPATLAGVRLLPAGRLGPGLLLVREAAACAPPVPAAPGALWDGRFRLRGDVPAGCAIGALGDDAARFRRARPLPSAVLRALPALRRAGRVVAVPHLGYVGAGLDAALRFDAAPPHPAAGAAFFSVPGDTFAPS